MEPQERLHQAQLAAREGRYEEALREYIWFHEHALELEPALYGVRLSFALGYWLDLAQDYPAALDSLKDIRDRKTQRLIAGEGDRELFHDVESINEWLKDERATYDLFLNLRALHPDLALSCTSLAIPAIVKAKDYKLARELISDPREKIRKWSTVLNEDIADLAECPVREAPAQDAYVHIYAGRVNVLLEILAGVGECSAAEEIKAFALESVESSSIREAVNVALASGTTEA